MPYEYKLLPNRRPNEEDIHTIRYVKRPIGADESDAEVKRAWYFEYSENSKSAILVDYSDVNRNTEYPGLTELAIYKLLGEMGPEVREIRVKPQYAKKCVDGESDHAVQSTDPGVNEPVVYRAAEVKINDHHLES